MKIGIITIQRSPNYGACLQSYGLYFFLKSRGYDCEVIDLLRPTHDDYIPSKKYLPYRQKRQSIFRRFLSKAKKTFRYSKSEHSITNEAKRKFDSFNSLISYSRTYYSIDELYQSPPRYDLYITGSDQLWNPTMGFCIEPYFLTFVKNGAKKISYATSLGINKLDAKEKEDFTRWLSDYYSISVREKSGRKILSDLVKQEVTQVEDPTFLLEPSQWKNLMVNPKIREPYILLFTLNFRPKLLDFCNRIRKESGKKLIYMCLYQPVDVSSLVDEIICNAGPKEFLGLINSASMVITDSFHGTVFSLILGAGNVFAHVPLSQKRGKRITDLLSTYHLTNHVLGDDLSISYQELKSRIIDKCSLNEMMIKGRSRSQEYLLKQLQ